MGSISRWPATVLAIGVVGTIPASCGGDGVTATLPTADDIVLTEIADKYIDAMISDSSVNGMAMAQ